MPRFYYSQCDQMLEKNVVQMFSKDAQMFLKDAFIQSTSVFTQIELFQNSTKVTNLYGATFVSKFVTNNFKTITQSGPTDYSYK